MQSDPAIDQLIRQSLTRQIAKAIDNAALNGDGSAPNPTGILATSGINTFATAGSSTMLYTEALSALSKLEEDDVPSVDAVFLVHPTDYAVIASSTIDAGSGLFTVAENGRIAGRRVIQSSLVPAGTVALGLFRHCMVGLFGGTDLVVDNVTEARSAKVLITQHQMADVAVRYPEAFCDITLTAYRIKELCQASGVGRTTIYKLIADGRLKVVRIGGCTIITADSAENLFRGQEGVAE